MPFRCPHRRAQRISAVVATLFGLATLFAGGRILLGFGEAGYTVVPMVLWFNTMMGLVYIAAAVLIARAPEAGRLAAAAIALVNLAVLVLIGVRRASGGAVANETLVAMTLRTAVWAGILVLTTRALRTHPVPSTA